MALLLTRRDVEGLLDLDTAMEVTLGAFREHAAGSVSALAARHLDAGEGRALRIVSGGLLGAQRIGVRAGPAVGFPDRASSGNTVALLWDGTSGRLLSIMAYMFGTLRTGATIGLATRLFAREGARVAGMIGTGRNALSLLQAVCHVRRIEQALVYSRDADHRAAFAREAEAALGLPVQPVTSAEAAAKPADVLCVATNSLTPVVTADQISAGAFVAAMGRPSELDPSVYLGADRLVVGGKEQEEAYTEAKSYPHQLLQLVKDGRLDWASDVHELPEVVTGRFPARASANEVVVFKESQGGFGDVAFCSYVYEAARRKGLGTEVEL